MDDILEFVFDLILEGLGAIVSSDRVPRWIRAVITTVIMLPLSALFVMLALLDHIAAKVIGWILFTATLTLWVYALRCISEGKRLGRDDDEE